VTSESPILRKSTPGDASMCRSIRDLAFSMDPNIKIEPEVEDVRQLIFSFLAPHRVYPPLAAFFWILPTSSSTRSPISDVALPGTAEVTRDLQLHLGAWLVPPLFQPSWLTYHRRRTQSLHPHPWICIGHDAYRASPSGPSAYHPQCTKHKKWCPGHIEFASEYIVSQR
jgi:hypothetical protein